MHGCCAAAKAERGQGIPEIRVPKDGEATVKASAFLKVIQTPETQVSIVYRQSRNKSHVH